ncbi:MAG: endonuclease domain-containing protein [Balneolaceae bacterium]
MARELRKNQTESEKILWNHLRNKQLNGYRFVRQKPLIYEQISDRRYFFIADFYCPQEKLVIELDGKVHEYQQYYDYQRDLVLREFGLTTIRFKNSDLGKIEKVLKKIINHLDQ